MAYLRMRPWLLPHLRLKKGKRNHQSHVQKEHCNPPNPTTAFMHTYTPPASNEPDGANTCKLPSKNIVDYLPVVPEGTLAVVSGVSVESGRHLD